MSGARWKIGVDKADINALSVLFFSVKASHLRNKVLLRVHSKA